MKIKVFFAVLFCFFLGISAAQAEEPISLYFFYGDGCPHCAKEELFLDKLEKQNDDIRIFRYETWHNRRNAALLSELGRKFGVTVPGVPMLFIGDQTVTGFYNEETTGEKIKKIINDYRENGCQDVVGQYLKQTDQGGRCEHGCDLDEEECEHDCGCGSDTAGEQEMPEKVDVPLFGEVDVKSVSLPVLTFLLAAADGFNPCAMWVLLFLISLLLGMENRRRMWLLGAAFIAASGAVYFLFLTAWLNLFLVLGFVFWIRIAIGLVALVSGGLHLKHAWDNREGCPVTSGEKRQKVFARLKELVSKKSLWISLFGIVLLASAVNLVELVCSAGLPAVYTSVLALSGLATWQYYAYILLYILIFMLDDLLVFVAAMSTLQIKAVNSRYTKWAGWVGGVLMVIIGFLLIFKPGWLMFG